MRDAAEDRPILVVAGNGEVCGYDRRTGRQVWKHEVTTKILGMTARVHGAFDLQIQGGRVYVAEREAIVCLDYLSGALIGRVKLASASTRVTFVIDGDHLYVVSGTTLECFTVSGERVWSTTHRDIAASGFALGFPGNVRQGDERG